MLVAALACNQGKPDSDRVDKVRTTHLPQSRALIVIGHISL